MSTRLMKILGFHHYFKTSSNILSCYRSRSASAGQKAILAEVLKAGKVEEQRRNVTGDIISPGQVMGIEHLRDPRLNKVGKCM